MVIKKKSLTSPSIPVSTRVPSMDFTALVAAIGQVHAQSAAAASRAINTTLTLRNWVIGAYIHHYELNGADRAAYGQRLMEKLAQALSGEGVPSGERARLYAYLAFFRAYPQIREAVPSLWLDHLPVGPETSTGAIARSATGQSDVTPVGEIAQSVTGNLGVNGAMLLERLSYTHLECLTAIEEPLKRAFYEIECIRGNWAVRALKRQIATLYFERSALSKDQEKLVAMVSQGVETAEARLAIRDPYIFEFLGLRAQDAVAESDLEAALVANLREFLLELGHGFCLEAQQKSILIGKTRGFVDLVFYHRILKCHVLVELKVDKFTHEHIGQLNTYVTWYRKHMMVAGDNPPVGLLLCTEQDHTLVEYATASMDNQLFVSKYQLELPSKESLQKFVETSRKEVIGPA